MPAVAKGVLHFFIIAGEFFVLGHRLPGFHVDGFMTALLAALILGVVNATIGLLIKILAFPITLLTLGLFSFVINAVLIQLVAFITPGLSINGFWPALVAALVLAGVNLIWKMATGRPSRAAQE